MKTTTLFGFIWVITLSSLSAQTNYNLPFLHVEGNKILNESGEEVRLRGVSFSDPDKLEKQGHWNREYFEEAKNWGSNLVRFPVHPRAWRERGQQEYLKLIDQGLEWANELEMYVIIDWHTIGNPKTELVQAPMYETTMTETLRFWQTISTRYRNNPVAAFYEIWNEATRYNGTLGRISWEEYSELMEEVIYVIYAHDPTIIPLVGGFNWAYDLTSVKEDPIDAEGIAYVAHPYPQKREQPWEPKWEADWGFVADTYPMIATEFGFMSEDGPGAHIPVIGDETYGEAIISYYEKKGISWTVWVFDPQWSPQMFSDWDFTPTDQGAFFREKMLELNK
jgi:aryl-phospho-beta-D-glucosidase BglC (GH1 family)